MRRCIQLKCFVSDEINFTTKRKEKPDALGDHVRFILFMLLCRTTEIFAFFGSIRH